MKFRISVFCNLAFPQFSAWFPKFLSSNDTSAHTSYLAWNFGIGQDGSRGCLKFKHMIRAGFDANNAVCLLLKQVLTQSVLIQAVPFEMERVRMFTPLFYRNFCENNFFP